jgi:phage shock protein A
MGIFSRFSDIVNSNIHALLDKAEDPQKMVRLIIQEMEDTLVEVRSTAARAIADRKSVERRIEVLQSDAADWEAKAELAVSREREDLAKAALVEKSALDDQLDALQSEREQLQQNLEQLNEDIARLQAKLNDARNRQRSLVQRQRTASHRVEMRRKVHDQRLDDAMSRFESYEERLDRLEGEAESLDMGRSPDLREHFRNLEAGEKVDRELEVLKARVRGKDKRKSSGGK